MQLALDFTPQKMNRQAVLLAIAAKQGCECIERGAAKAQAIAPGFVDAAGAHMLAYLSAHGTSSGELLTDSCKLAGIRSSDDRHFGVVFRSLIRRGLIRWAGECRRVKGHASRGGSLYCLVVAG